MPFSDGNPNLINGFLKSVQNYPENIALWVNDVTYTYEQLYDRVYRLAQVIQRSKGDQCIIHTGRTWVAYAGVLACLLAGKTYVPMKPSLPFERNSIMLQQLNCQSLLIDHESVAFAETLLKQFSQEMTLIFPEDSKSDLLNYFEQQHLIYDKNIFDNRIFDEQLTKSVSPYAYLMFTSGTTGIPKSVAVSHTNILHYLDVFIERAKPNCHDRFIQLADLTFDFSVHDCFNAWQVGASVYVFSQNFFLALAEFVNHHHLTFWGSVPSVALLLCEMRRLSDGYFPTLRYSMFCGEVLTEHIACRWAKIAPQSIIDNFYGPTEGAVCFTGYTWQPNADKDNSGIVPIGWSFRDLEVLLVDEFLKPVNFGECGELLISGPQVVDGYWHNESLSAQAFITLTDQGGQRKCWYRTGDLAVMDATCGLRYKGRYDEQIQISGRRVEKSEIELCIKKIARTEFVAVIPWPFMLNTMIYGVIGFVAGSKVSQDLIITECRRCLPDYMIPREIHFIDSLPYNLNGKLDYRALQDFRSQCKGNDYENGVL